MIAVVSPHAAASDLPAIGPRPHTRRRVPGGSGPSASPWSARRGCGRSSAGNCAMAGPRPRSRAGCPPSTRPTSLAGCLMRRSASRCVRPAGVHPGPRADQPAHGLQGPQGWPGSAARAADPGPAEVTGRQVPGRWEGDVVIGKNGRIPHSAAVDRTGLADRRRGNHRSNRRAARADPQVADLGWWPGQGIPSSSDPTGHSPPGWRPPLLPGFRARFVGR